MLAAALLVRVPVVLDAAVAHVQTLNVNNNGAGGSGLTTASFTSSAGELLIAGVSC